MKTWGELTYGVPEEDVRFAKHMFMALGIVWGVGAVLIFICLVMGW